MNPNRDNLQALRKGILMSSLAGGAVLGQLAGVYDLSSPFQAFVFVYVVIVGLFLSAYCEGRDIDFFSPGVGLTVLLFLYAVSSALFAETTGLTAHNDPVGDDVLTTYYFSCLAGLIGLVGGMLFAQRIKMPATGIRFPSVFLVENNKFHQKLFWAALLLGGIFCYRLLPWFNFLNVPSYAERALALRLERMQDSASGITETLFTNLPLTLILCLATLYVFTSRKRAYMIAGSVIILSYLARNTMAGWRGQVMAAVIIPAIFYHYRVRRIKTVAAVLSGALVYLFVNVMSFVRSTSNLGEMYNLVQAALQSGDAKFLSFTSSTELLVGTNLLRLISGINANESGFTYGLSLISEFLVFIPKVLFPSRPLPLSEQFAATFYPGELEQGGGFGFFFLQEGYWAGGVLGVLVLTFVYGWCVETIFQWVKKNIHYDAVPLIYAVMYNALVLAAVRSGLFGNFKNLLMGLIPFLVVFLLPSLNRSFLCPAEKKEAERA
ncbi:oligosaccharide repeat unit polymerase [Geomonas oryzisoli]|uniref:Oligosaccharide repeat unit polymerase n=1 Tax=Geomonas oryzisoli TaxID=2847992 RepID=A0ABX8J5J2_9BACT|nr:O-antigen polymerase [Geomonas oryzisoli]QWV91959.1 oligosaccharide repeat unit polymerase [Geomonas oryzisoli]